jgi:hypothetical protein
MPNRIRTASGETLVAKRFVSQHPTLNGMHIVHSLGICKGVEFMVMERL